MLTKLIPLIQNLINRKVSILLLVEREENTVIGLEALNAKVFREVSQFNRNLGQFELFYHVTSTAFGPKLSVIGSKSGQKPDRC